MAPILIDGRGMLKLGFTSLLVMTIIFSSGFFAGYQRAAEYYQYGSEVEALLLPEVETSLREQQLPENTFVGENIDVDQASLEDQLSSQASDVITPAKATNPGQGFLDTPQISLSESESVNINPAQLNYAGSEVTVSEITEVKTQTDSRSVDYKNSAKVDAEKAKYSIQVGMYGSIANAKKMTKVLQLQQLDSYITNYINDNNEYRYNVRFGYFPDKKAALEQLKHYRNIIKGDGYLVRFSANNIVNPEQNEITENTAAVEEITRNQLNTGEVRSEHRQASELTPLEVKLDKLDTLSSAEILTL